MVNYQSFFLQAVFIFIFISYRKALKLNTQLKVLNYTASPVFR